MVLKEREFVVEVEAVAAQLQVMPDQQLGWLLAWQGLPQTRLLSQVQTLVEVEGVIESELAHQAAGGERLIQVEEVALAQKSAEVAAEELVQMWGAAAAAVELAQTKGEVVEYQTQMQMASAMNPAAEGVSCLVVGEVLS